MNCCSISRGTLNWIVVNLRGSRGVVSWLSLLIILSLNIGYCYALQENDYSQKLNSLIQSQSPRSFNGVILITQNGKVKYSKAVGYSDFVKKTPLKLSDNFRIQSNSKQVTAVLILREVDKGKIQLAKPISSYIKDLKQKWADTKLNAITNDLYL